MWNRKKSVTLSLVICAVITLCLFGALFCIPQLVKLWFVEYRGWDDNTFQITDIITTFCFLFYPSAAFGFAALYNLTRLLVNIRSDNTFTDANVKYLRRISWCCIAVSVIALIAGFFYIPFLFIFVAAGFVGLMLRIVKNVMQSAVELQQENDLTI